MSETDPLQLPPIASRAESSGQKSHQGSVQDPLEPESHQSRTQDKTSLLKSPFALPSEQEVFLFCENERQKKLENKKIQQDLRIWDKKTATCRNSLKHYKNFQSSMEDQSHPTKPSYNSKDRRLINDAKQIAADRKKKNENEATKTDSVVEVLEQKKEMFLVTMSHGIITEEIDRLKKQQEEKAQALEQSEKMLKKDEADFSTHVEDNKKRKELAEQQEKTKNQQKQKKDQLIKEKNTKQSTLKGEMIKNEEFLKAYLDHKDFIDKLADKEWLEKKQQEKQELINKVRPEWVKRHLDMIQEVTASGDIKNIQSLPTFLIKHVTNNFEEENKQQQHASKSTQNRSTGFKTKEKNEKFLTEQFESQKDKIEAIEDFEDNYELHFHSPDQLVDHFDLLEEKNLTLIKWKQDDEHIFEEIKSRDSKFKKDMQQSLKEQNSILADLKDQCKEQDKQIGNLKKKSEQNLNINKFDDKKLREKIHQLYTDLKFGDTEGDHKEPIEQLTKIERLLEKLLKQINKLCRDHIQKVNKCVKETENTRQLKKRELMKKQAEDIQIKKKMKNDKQLEAYKKRDGRIDMKRSNPFDKKQKKVQVNCNNNEDEDKKYFMENFQFSPTIRQDK